MNDELEQIRAVHLILHLLLDKEVLSGEPLTVEMSRDDYPSVFPCRRMGKAYTKNALDLDQINWALNEGKWWFTGPIRILKIDKIKRKQLTESDIDFLKHMAKNAGFSLSLEKVNNQRSI